MYIWNNINELNDYGECLICWQPSSTNNSVICMKEFNKYDITCECNSYFHLDCFDKWITLKNICPICRNNTISIKISPYSNLYYLSSCIIMYNFRYIIYSILYLLVFCNALVLITYFVIIVNSIY